MTREEYEQLLIAIAGDSEPIGIEATRGRQEAEQAVLATTSRTYWGLVALGDAISQFYVDTLRELASTVTKASVNPTEALLIQWHLVAFSRYSAAFDLFCRGYYSESATLARGLWETALTMAGLRQGAVPVEDIFGGRAAGESLTPRQVARRLRDTDARIQDALIWKNNRMSVSAREAVETYLRLLNAATHKAQLALALNMELVRRREPIPIFPRFDSKRSEATGNLLFPATWCLIATLPYLQSLLTSAGNEWRVRHEKFLLVFSESFGAGSSPVVRGFGEAIGTIFTAPG
jgi:hypothetical protein